MACAQCHHHKYDPFSQRDYYGVFSIFNNTDDFNTDNPVVESPRVGQDTDFADLKIELAAVQSVWDAVTQVRDARAADWEKALAAQKPPADASAQPDRLRMAAPPTRRRQMPCRRKLPTW